MNRQVEPTVADYEEPRESDAGWITRPLGELLQVSQYGLSVRGERTGRCPILRMNCQDSGRVVMRDLQYVDISSRELDQYRLRDRDILFNRTNSYELVGRTAIFRGNDEVVFASYLLRLRVDESKILPEYLNFFLNSPECQSTLKTLATRGVSQANISASKLRLLPVQMPPIREQKAVVRVLETLLDRLEVSRRRVAMLDALKAATATNLLCEGLHGERLRDSEAGKISEGWTLTRIGDLGTVITGSTPRTSVQEFYVGGGVPFITPGDLGSHLRLQKTAREISTKGLAVSRAIPTGAVCFVSIGSTIGKVGLTSFSTAATNQQIKSIIPGKNVDARFLCLLLWYHSERIASRANPGPVPILSKTGFESAVVPMPQTVEEQSEIANSIWPIEQAHELAVRHQQLLDALFWTTLNQLMNGTVSLAALDTVEEIHA